MTQKELFEQIKMSFDEHIRSKQIDGMFGIEFQIIGVDMFFTELSLIINSYEISRQNDVLKLMEFAYSEGGEQIANEYSNQQPAMSFDDFIKNYPTIFNINQQ